MSLIVARGLCTVVLAAYAGWLVHKRKFGMATFYALIVLATAP